MAIRCVPGGGQQKNARPMGALKGALKVGVRDALSYSVITRSTIVVGVVSAARYAMGNRFV